MSVQLKLIAWLSSVGIVFVVLFGAVKYGRHIEYIEQKAANADAIQAATKANDKLKSELEVQREKHDRDLAAIPRAPRVRVPTCTGVPNTTGGSGVPATTTERPDDRSQQLLDEATKHLESKADEWSRALNACAVVMGWAKAR